MRLSDLRHKDVRSLDGKRLGRIQEVHCDKGKVIALICGRGSFIERWTAHGHGRRISWDDVRRFDGDSVVISLNSG
jgi:sporulation protein YlmC with PRC-barrel domain